MFLFTNYEYQDIKPNKNMQVEEVVGHLKVYEERLHFSSMKGHDAYNKKGRGCGRGPVQDGKGGHDNTLQIHDNANPWKDESMIKCYSCGKYVYYVIQEANLTLTHDYEPTLMLAEKMPEGYGELFSKRRRLSGDQHVVPRQQTKQPYDRRLRKVQGLMKHGLACLYAQTSGHLSSKPP